MCACGVRGWVLGGERDSCSEACDGVCAGYTKRTTCDNNIVSDSTLRENMPDLAGVTSTRPGTRRAYRYRSTERVLLGQQSTPQHILPHPNTDRRWAAIPPRWRHKKQRRRRRQNSSTGARRGGDDLEKIRRGCSGEALRRSALEEAKEDQDKVMALADYTPGRAEAALLRTPGALPPKELLHGRGVHLSGADAARRRRHRPSSCSRRSGSRNAPQRSKRRRPTKASYNQIGDEGAVALAEAVGKGALPELKELPSGNKLSQRAKDAWEAVGMRRGCGWVRVGVVKDGLVSNSRRGGGGPDPSAAVAITLSSSLPMPTMQRRLVRKRRRRTIGTPNLHHLHSSQIRATKIIRGCRPRPLPGAARPPIRNGAHRRRLHTSRCNRCSAQEVALFARFVSSSALRTLRHQRRSPPEERAAAAEKRAASERRIFRYELAGAEQRVVRLCHRLHRSMAASIAYHAELQRWRHAALPPPSRSCGCQTEEEVVPPVETAVQVPATVTAESQTEPPHEEGVEEPPPSQPPPPQQQHCQAGAAPPIRRRWPLRPPRRLR